MAGGNCPAHLGFDESSHCAGVLVGMNGMKFASAATTQLDTGRAALEVRQSLERQLGVGVTPDLIVFFATRVHVRCADVIVSTLQAAWREAALLGTTAVSVLHPSAAEQNRPTLAALAARLPGVGLVPFRMKLEDFEQAPIGLEKWQGLLETSPDPKLIILLADPFTTPATELLDTLNAVAPGVRAVGGLASGARRQGGHTLVLNDSLHRSGLVGVALSGNLRADTIVSQGYRPVGRAFRVTRATGNVVQELSGVPALEALERMVSTLPREEQVLLRRGLMLGEAIGKPAEGVGRGSFLIRPVVGLDHEEGAISLAGLVDEGQTIRFQVWDNTLLDDLRMLLLPQLADSAAAGSLLFGSWPGRRAPQSDELSAREIELTLGYSLPLAGFRTSGEIGPLGGINYVHTHTAALTLLRPAEGVPRPAAHAVE